MKVQFELIQPVKAAATAALLSSLQPTEPAVVLSALRQHTEPPSLDRRLKAELPDVGEPPPVETLLAHLEAENMQKEIDGKFDCYTSVTAFLEEQLSNVVLKGDFFSSFFPLSVAESVIFLHLRLRAKFGSGLYFITCCFFCFFPQPKIGYS